MKDKCQFLYLEMLKDIDRCLQLPLSEIEQLECCCRVSINYWEQLKAWIKTNRHIVLNSEIEFFKNYKPQFTGLIEYYTQRCQAVLFQPQNDKEEQEQFWKRELVKIRHFYDEHKDFCEYYANGDTDKDYIYFVSNDNEEDYQKKRIYNADKETSSSYDYQIAAFIAYHQYEKYISQQLKIFEQ